MPAGFASHMVAMKAAHDVYAIANAEGIGQMAQIARGYAAFHLVAVVAQQTQEAGAFPFDVPGVVRNELQAATSLQKMPQRSIRLRASEREDRKVRVEQLQSDLAPGEALSKMRLKVGA